MHFYCHQRSLNQNTRVLDGVMKGIIGEFVFIVEGRRTGEMVTLLKYVASAISMDNSEVCD